MMVLLYYKTGAYYITYICTALPRQEEGQREATTDWGAKHSRGGGSSYGLGTLAHLRAAAAPYLASSY